MAKDKDDKSTGEEKKKTGLKPDPKTLHTTDPQDEMEGPVSSIVQSVKEEVEENGDKDKADKKKD